MLGLCGTTEYNYYTNTGFLLGVALSAPSAGSGCQACSVHLVGFLGRNFFLGPDKNFCQFSREFGTAQNLITKSLIPVVV